MRYFDEKFSDFRHKLSFTPLKKKRFAHNLKIPKQITLDNMPFVCMELLNLSIHLLEEITYLYSSTKNSVTCFSMINAFSTCSFVTYPSHSSFNFDQHRPGLYCYKSGSI